VPSLHQMLWRLVEWFLSNLANKKTNADENTTSLAEMMKQRNELEEHLVYMYHKWSALTKQPRYVDLGYLSGQSTPSETCTLLQIIAKFGHSKFNGLGIHRKPKIPFWVL